MSGIEHPFICENGAALFVPAGYFADPLRDGKRRGRYHVFEYGEPHAHVAVILDLLAAQLGVEVAAFSDVSEEYIARACHLPLGRARLMKLREYDEPFRLIKPDATAGKRLARALYETGLRCVSCGDHEHVNGVIDRAAGLERLRSLFEQAHGGPVLTVGLGNSLCDLPLLKEVDLPIIVRDEWPTSTEVLLRKVPIARITSSCGAGGWSHAVLDVVHTLQHMRKASVWVRPA